ncbi:MAG: efflux RND transporter periplasmic adaptor subunit [Planctomycetota bacterium]
MIARAFSAVLFGLILLAAAGCGDNSFQPPPPPAVTVAAPLQRDVVEYVSFTGLTKADDSIDVRARVQGIIEEVAFEAGAFVKEGDLLFLIDPAPFEAARDAAAAQVVTARAQAELARTQAERVERSATDGAVSELQALQARAEAEVADAAVMVAEKELAIRELDVGYTRVVAPISGYAEHSSFGKGDLVGEPGGSGLLTTIYDDAVVNVEFAVADRVYLEAVRNRGGRGAARGEPPPVQIGTEVDDGFPFVGLIDYTDPVVDGDTGTIRVRAKVDNAEGRLLGGLFVRIRLPVRELEGTLVVADTAIGSDQVGSYVLVVNDENVVERRDISLGPVDGADRVVLEGLAPDDRVVVRGLLRARPGSKVTPETAEANDGRQGGA